MRDLGCVLLIVVLSVSSFVPLQSWADEQSAQKIVENINRHYQTIKNVSARFEQTFYWKLADERQKITGKIFIKDGKKYRVETADQIIVTDGKTVWTLSEANKQVIIDLLNENAQQNPLMREFIVKYSKEYKPTIVGQEIINDSPCQILELTPKNDDMFITSVRIWVDTKTWLMLKVEQTDINENITTYLISNIDIAAALSDNLFKLEIPKDYEVIDLR